MEVLVLLVRSEEGFLLECRIPCAGRLLQALFLFQHPELLTVLGFRHSPLLRFVGSLQLLLAGCRFSIYRRLVGPVVVLTLLGYRRQFLNLGLKD